MELKLDVIISDSEILIEFDNKKSKIKIINSNKLKENVNEKELFILLKEDILVDINNEVIDKYTKENSYNKIIMISANKEINMEGLKDIFINDAISNNIELINGKISSDIESLNSYDINEYKDKIIFILKKFGYELFKIKSNSNISDKKHTGKARHKWTKDISTIKFIAESSDGKGEAIWRKKDQLVLLSGAKLVNDPQINKDGRVNYSAKFAQKLRSDNSDKIKNNVTTEDIIFESPNMLGMFLFYGGQNTWQELKDDQGKSLDDWSRID